MAEPQPPTSPPTAPPAAASAAAEAAALSSLDNKTLTENDSSTAPKKEIDLKALNAAMKALETGSSSSSGEGGKKAATSAAKAEPVKVVKVDGGDVGLLAEQLDLSRAKATELLRAHDADPVRAMKAWVTT